MKTKRHPHTLSRKLWLHCQIFAGLLVFIISSPLAIATTISEGEGETLEIEVKLEGPLDSSTELEYDYTTEDGEAKASNDYTAISGTLKFQQYQQTKKLYIDILADSVDRECKEKFVLQLKNPRMRYISHGTWPWDYNPCWDCYVRDTGTLGVGEYQCSYCANPKTITVVIQDRTNSYWNQHYGSCYTGSTYGE